MDGGEVLLDRSGLDLSLFDPDGPAAPGCLFGLPHSAEQSRVVVLPVPFEATTSYRHGTVGGPQAVLEASAQVDLWDEETGDPWKEGIAMVSPEPWIGTLSAETSRAVVQLREGGGEALIESIDAAGARLGAFVHRWTLERLDAGQIPAILGGDHSTPLGAMQAVLERDPSVGVLQVDAHADLRCAYEGMRWSHASIAYNLLDGPVPPAKLVQVGVRDQCWSERRLALEDPRVEQWTDVGLRDALMDGACWAQLSTQMVASLPQKVWISFDIDGLEPALCPGTGTPVPGGLSWHQATALLAALGQSGRQIVGFDLCEVSDGQWDAMVGARLLYKLAGWAISTQKVS